MLSHARINTPPGVFNGPWHLIDEVRINVAATVESGRLEVRCGIEMPLSELDFAPMGYDRSRGIQCGDCTKAEALRLTQIADSIRDFGWTSVDGYCRHGVYVGGSGIDWMCGTCETYGVDEEVELLRESAADLLRKAVYL